MTKKLLTGIIASLTMAGSISMARPPTSFTNVVGVWNNANPATGGIVRVIVRRTVTGISVQPFGACSPTPCNHGIIGARAFSPGVGNAQASGFNAVRNFGFKSTNYNAILQGNVMTLLTQDTFAGADTRFNYTSMERFVRATAAPPESEIEISTPVSDHGSAADLE